MTTTPVTAVVAGSALASFAEASGALTQPEPEPMSEPLGEVDVLERSRRPVIVATPQNSMSAETAALPGVPPCPDVGRFLFFPYRFYPIRRLASLDARGGNTPLSRVPVRSEAWAPGFDVVTSGTFYFMQGQERYAAGPVVVDGTLVANGVDKSAHRGGVAILRDGSIVVGRQDGNSLAEIERQFGPVQGFQGGAVLLVEDGQPVDFDDIQNVQRFDQCRDLQSGQLARSNHIILGIKDGQAWLVVATFKTGADLQRDLCAAGFDTALKLDGGGPAFWRDSGGAHWRGKHPFGFGVDVKA